MEQVKMFSPSGHDVLLEYDPETADMAEVNRVGDGRVLERTCYYTPLINCPEVVSIPLPPWENIASVMLLSHRDPHPFNRWLWDQNFPYA